MRRKGERVTTKAAAVTAILAVLGLGGSTLDEANGGKKSPQAARRAAAALFAERHRGLHGR